MKFELINKAEVFLEDSTVNVPSEGLMCLDACQCTGNCNKPW